MSVVKAYPGSISCILYEAAIKLKNAGIKEGRSEAEIILSEITGLSRLKLYANSKESVSPAVKEHFDEAVKLRSKRFPMAYVVGKKEFYGHEYYISPEVMVPRPESELLIDAVRSRLNNSEKGYFQELNIVDLGTGSGVLAITLALLFPRSLLWAVDVSPEALKVAQKNARLHRVDDRITFLEGDFWEALDSKPYHFNMIISNPPYIPRCQLDNLEPEIKKYEPRCALDGGADGLESYRNIFAGMKYYASLPAILALEIDINCARKIISLGRQEPLIKEMEIINDYSNLDRIFMGLMY